MAKAPKQDQKTATQPDIMPEIDDDAQDSGEIVEASQTEPDQPPERQEPEKRQEPEDPRAAIARKYRENRDAKASAETDDEGDGADDESAGDQPGDQQAAADQAPDKGTQAPEQKPDLASQDPEVVLKVDGKDVRMKQSEAIALAQQQMAGINRLDEAKNVLVEVRQLREELRTNTARAPRGSEDPENQRDRADEKSTHSKTTSQGDDNGANQSQLNIDPEKLRDIVQRIQVGDETEGAEAFMDAMKIIAANRPELKTEQVAQIVQDTIDKNQTAVEINQALHEFGQDYPDVVKNKYLADAGLHILRDELVADLKAAGIPEDKIAPIEQDASALAAAQRLVRRQNPKAELRSYKQLLGAVGEKLSSDFGIKRREDPTQQQQQPSAQPSNAPQQRLERKRAASQQPKPAGVRQAITPAAKPRDRRAVVEQMKRDRGFGL